MQLKWKIRMTRLFWEESMHENVFCAGKPWTARERCARDYPPPGA